MRAKQVFAVLVLGAMLCVLVGLFDDDCQAASLSDAFQGAKNAEGKDQHDPVTGPQIAVGIGSFFVTFAVWKWL